MNDSYKGEGWSSFWTPVLAACLFLALLLYLAYSSSRQIEKQIDSNIDKKFGTTAKPVFIPKYEPATQAKIDSIEINRQILHRDVDILADEQLQSVLDSLYNNK